MIFQETRVALRVLGMLAIGLGSSGPALAHGETLAKDLFSKVEQPAEMKPAAFGGYAKGCLAGAKTLAPTGDAWQAMRLSRNRNHGHPALIDFIEKLAREAKAEDGWRKLLVGDLSQPRGGPMPGGHKSHQIGLDADIWLTPGAGRDYTRAEREKVGAVSMLKDLRNVDTDVWTGAHFKLLKRAGSSPKVARIFVHPAIKRALCETEAKNGDRAWLGKMRPWWGHYAHFHVRLACPPGEKGCKNQAPPAAKDGCGKELAWWLSDKPWAKPDKDKDKKQAKPKPRGLTLAQLPAACKRVLDAEPVKAIPATAEPAAAGPATQ